MHRLDKDATIYNYTLIKRIRHRPLPLALYGLLPLPAIVLLTVSGSSWSWLWFAVGLTGLPILYAAITWLFLRLMTTNQRGAWAFLWRFPWLGLLPEQHFPLRTVIHLHHQLLAIGLAVIACLYPWMPAAGWYVLLGVHLWHMAPRYGMFFLLRLSKKPGLLKLNSRDTSYYVD